jgi:hypothetical protein
LSNNNKSATGFFPKKIGSKQGLVKEKKTDPDNTRDSAGYYCSVQLAI